MMLAEVFLNEGGADEVARLRAFFCGHVQGVGFRWQATQVAKGFCVSGWVKNLPDGRVELLAEGESGEVKAFYAAVAEAMASYIRETTHKLEKTHRSCQGFRIVH
jgi:acylphosphatase